MLTRKVIQETHALAKFYEDPAVLLPSSIDKRLLLLATSSCWVPASYLKEWWMECENDQSCSDVVNVVNDYTEQAHKAYYFAVREDEYSDRVRFLLKMLIVRQLFSPHPLSMEHDYDLQRAVSFNLITTSNILADNARSTASIIVGKAISIVELLIRR